MKVEPDSLAKIIDTLEGAIIPMLKSMDTPLTYQQMRLVNCELVAISKRLWDLYGIRRMANGDDN